MLDRYFSEMTSGESVELLGSTSSPHRSMKAQFCLMLITLNGLLLCAPSASASVATPESQVAHLSQTIANLIDFDDRNLVAQAINRALLAQNTNEDPDLNVAGGITVNPPTEPKPIINGRIANPKPEPTRGEGSPRLPQEPPVNTPTKESPMLINGLIINNNRLIRSR